MVLQNGSIEEFSRASRAEETGVKEQDYSGWFGEVSVVGDMV